jgi:UDP-N-acetyl-D-mannosaminuronate dehydrogenase
MSLLGFVHPRGRSLKAGTGLLGIRTGRKSDAVVIVTDHSSVDYEMVARHASAAVDTRGVFRATRPNVVKA